MPARRQLCGICIITALLAPALAQTGHQASVRRLSVINENPIRLKIETSEPVAPQVQIVSGPERLVIDIPNSTPGSGLHSMVAMNRGQIKGVRVSLFSTSPPVTRIVVDLKQPQWYRVQPDVSGFLVILGSDAETAADPQPTIGWVSARVSAKTPSIQPAVLVRKAAARPNAGIGTSKVTVQYANGLLTIHAHGATLSEVLFQIQKQTGAEIAIPSGTEQDQVAADFGPGRASDVLAQLLNGSGLNFVVVGSEADPNALRSVILSRNSGGPAEPAQFVAPTYVEPTAENIEPQGLEIVPPPPTENNQPPQEAPGNGPPIETPPY